MNGLCWYRYAAGMHKDLWWNWHHRHHCHPAASTRHCQHWKHWWQWQAPSMEKTWSSSKSGVLSTTTSEFDSSVLGEAWIKTNSDAAYPETPKGKSVDVSSCPCSWESLGSLAFLPCFLLGRFLPFTILEQLTRQIGHNQGPQSNSRHTLIT